jgi:hypothetical protein
MLINDYLAMQLHKNREAELMPREGIRRVVREIINEHKANVPNVRRTIRRPQSNR